MNKLTQTLLTGTALCALVAAPVMAQPTPPAMRVTALHAGHVVNKTKRHDPCYPHYTCPTYTFGVYTSKPADAPPKTHLFGTFYKWNSANSSGNYTICSNPKQKVRGAKKSVYARIDKGTETYSFGCASGPTVFYGDLWTNKTGVAGNVDNFRSSLLGKFIGPSGHKYKGELDFDVFVSIQ